jgi:hypothetical protein
MSSDAVSTTPLEQKLKELDTVCEDGNIENFRIIFVAETILARLHKQRRPLPSISAGPGKSIVFQWEEGTKTRKRERRIVIEDPLIKLYYHTRCPLTDWKISDSKPITDLFRKLDEFDLIQPQ